MEKVDKFLYLILENRNCFDGGTGSPSAASEFLQKSEDMIIFFLKNEDLTELEFPPYNSFYRRIIHCLGRRYNLVHRVESTNTFNSHSTLRKIYLVKPIGDFQKFQGPILKSTDWIVDFYREAGIFETLSPKKSKKIRSKKAVEKVEIPKIKILKREREREIPTNEAVGPEITSPLLALENLTLEEREAKYQAARDRIFAGFIAEDLNEKLSNASNNFEVSNYLFTDVKNDVQEDGAVMHTDHYTTAIKTENQVSLSKRHSTLLNPDAVPFTFKPVVEDEAAPEPVIEINHIYTITSSAGQLTRDNLKEILANHPRATIKVFTCPSDSVFLLLPSDENICVNSDKWTFTKWIPEFYLD